MPRISTASSDFFYREFVGGNSVCLRAYQKIVCILSSPVLFLSGPPLLRVHSVRAAWSLSLKNSALHVWLLSPRPARPRLHPLLFAFYCRFKAGFILLISFSPAVLASPAAFLGCAYAKFLGYHDDVSPASFELH